MKLPLFNSGGMSRKEQRKSAKKLKKMQAKAFAQRTPIEQVMRESMGMTKMDKKRRKRQRQQEAKKEMRRLENRQKRINNEENSDEEDDEGDSEGADDEIPSTKAKNRNGIVEISVNRGKRKYGDESEDSDDDLTYEQYLEEVQNATKKRRREQDGIEDDDAAIRKYGILLGVNENKTERDGKKKVLKSMKNDGLDLLLDFCDSEHRKELMEKDVNDEQEELDDEEEDVEETELVLSEKEEEEDETVVDEMISDEEEDEIEDEETEDVSYSESETESINEKASQNGEPSKQEESEDIYGRKINKCTGELIKFDPAAARKKLEELEASSSSGEQKQRVERAVNSIINKLSDAMLIKSQQAIAELWGNTSKNDVKSALYKYLLKVLLAPFRLQDSLLVTYGAFIAMCHKMISNEISAHFVECFLCDLVKSMAEEEEIDDKSMENRVIFTAFLVVFRILQPSILIELIEKFAVHLNLTNLFAIRTLIAYTYRSLKKTSWSLVSQKIDEIAVEFQKKPISALPRAKFLLEEVVALKKAPPKAIDYDVVERQVKVLNGITKKKGSSASSDSKELTMTLNDLLHAEERGRWWIIGSAFRLPDQGGYGHLAATNASKKNVGATSFPPEVIQMAMKAGMNSEIRRQIFCSVATADDEDDAFERLLKLQLKGEKERELVHVLIAMMMKEKTFNAFYAALLQRFCEFNKRFVITLQFAVWDRLRDCDELKPFQRSSLSQLLHHLIANEIMAITVLKTVEWATRSPSLTTILKKLFLGLAKSPESVLKRVFEPVINPQKRAKFEILSEGMRVFWHMNLKDSEVYQKIDQWIMENGYY